ncbi:MAG: hypothetical protein KBD36_03570 [Alphaproteobacteria bacterium]|jgi:hypothetical protein|nr:hypothetical protein [Alphaproteobacteria bacterium]MBP9776903.1 hypothetical protein [Alphaproteobacteria bacterium]
MRRRYHKNIIRASLLGLGLSLLSIEARAMDHEEDDQIEHHLPKKNSNTENAIIAKNRIEERLGCPIEEASKRAIKEMNETLVQQLETAVKRANAGQKLIEEASAANAPWGARAKKWFFDSIHGQGYIEQETEQRSKIVVFLEEELGVLKDYI